MKINWKSFGLGMITMSLGLGLQSLNSLEPRSLINPNEWYNFCFSLPILIIIFFFIIPYIKDKIKLKKDGITAKAV